MTEVAQGKHKCVACGEQKDCVDLGYDFWTCSDCLAPAGRILADTIDKDILKKILSGEIKLPGPSTKKKKEDGNTQEQ